MDNRNLGQRNTGMSRSQFLRNAGIGAAALGAATMGMSGVASAAVGGTKLQEVRARKYLRAGYVNGWEGAGFNNGPTQYKGYATDYVRFYTVAVFSGYAPNITKNPDKYWKMVYGDGGNSRGTMLQNNQADVVDCQITMTISREATWGSFTATTLYDGGTVMHNKDFIAGSITSLAQLGAMGTIRIGYETQTTAESYIPALAAVYPNIIPVPYAGSPDDNPNNLPLFYDQAFADLASGAIQFISSDETYLRQLRIGYDSAFQSLTKWEIAASGPLGLSEEPLTPMTSGTDENWTDIIKWCIYASFAASQFGITKSNVDWHYMNGVPEAKSLLGAVADDSGVYLPEKLGLNRHAFRDALKTVGSWNEMWDRNMATPAPYGISMPRGYPNELPPNGLFYSPVFR